MSTRTARHTSYALLVFLSFTVPFSTPLYASVLVSGDATDGNSFTFKVGPNAAGVGSNDKIYFTTGAQEEPVTDAAKEWSVALASSDTGAFRALAPKEVRLNNVADAADPLYGQTVQYLALVRGTIPLLTLTSAPTTLYTYADTTAGKLHVISNSSLQDAAGAPIGAIKNVYGMGGIFAAVKTTDQTGDFGTDADDGIAYLSATTRPAPTSDLVKNPPPIASFDFFSTVRLTGAEPTVMINHPATINTPYPPDMYWDPQGTLFIAYDVTAGSADGDGARGIVGAIPVYQGKGILLRPIAPDTVFNASNQIVGVGPNAESQIRKVRVLHTSTGLPYLIVLGNSGSPAFSADPLQSIFALPLVLSKATGTYVLANKNFPPVLFSGSNYPYEVTGRAYNRLATLPGDVYTNTDVPAVVGGGLTPGTASDIFVNEDAVYVATNAHGTDTTVGIFYSQALFDQFGGIKGWTPWQRVAGTAGIILGFTLDVPKGNFWFMPGDDSGSLSVRRTLWGLGAGDGLLGGTTETGDNGLVSLVTKYLPESTSGVQGFFNFPSTTPSFSQQAGERLCAVIATGLGKIMIAKTADDTVGDRMNPVGGDFQVASVTFSNGAIGAIPDGTKLIGVSGGVLNDIGPITAATFVLARQISEDATEGFLVIGGSGGVAVLQKDGAGWDSADGAGLTSTLQELAGRSFVKVGSYKNVRKLIGDDRGQLYILTDTQLERINMQCISLGLDVWNDLTRPLANATDLMGQYGALSDVIVSGPLAILATSVGLLRSGNGVEIYEAGREDTPVNWTGVPVPLSAGSVTRLFPIGSGEREIDFATGSAGGMFYALSANVSLDFAHLNRFAVVLEDGAVTDNSVLPLRDRYVRDQDAYFVNLRTYRNYFVTDGSLFVVSRSNEQGFPPILQILPSDMHSPVRVTVNKSSYVPGVLASGTAMGKLVRSSGSGAWIASGSAGLAVNE